MKREKSFLSPIDNKSVVQNVIDRLTQAMIYKELKPGDQIPTELELSTSLGVGRNSVREAIKILVSFGVLEIRRPEGTFVTSGFSDKMIDPLLYGIILDETGSMDSLKELREWIDTGILLLAAKRAGQEDVEQLRQRTETLEAEVKNGDAEAVFDADNAFHDVLAQITHNALFGKIANLVRLLTYDIRRKTIFNMMKLGHGNRLAEVHREIFQILEQHDLARLDEVIKRSYFYEEGVLDA